MGAVKTTPILLRSTAPWSAVEPLQKKENKTPSSCIRYNTILAQQNPTYWENFHRAKKKAQTNFPRKIAEGEKLPRSHATTPAPL